MSEIIRQKSFTDLGLEYEARAWLEEDGVRIRVFRDGEPVGLTYSVTGATQDDFRAYGRGDAIRVLMDMAENDVRTHDRKPRGDRLPGITLSIDVDPPTFFARIAEITAGLETIGTGFVPATQAGRNLVNVARLPYDEQEGLVVQLLEIENDSSHVEVETRAWSFSPHRPTREQYLDATGRVLDPLLGTYRSRFGFTPGMSLDDE